MRFGIIVFPGSNCDYDCQDVTGRIMGQPTQFIWHEERTLPACDVIILPGGFSYGDHLRVGAIARFSPIMDAVISFAEKGGWVLGICNGFQILLECGLLPGVLLQNTSLKFICRWASLRVEKNQTTFTSQYRSGQKIRLPIAHAEGNYFIDPSGLASLKENNQIVFRYASASENDGHAENPNGSIEDIAGICNKEGNVLGMMPHPERAAESILGGTDGLALFQSLQTP